MADLEKVEQELNGGWVRTVKDLFAGASGGITQVLLGEFCATHSRYCSISKVDVAFDACITCIQLTNISMPIAIIHPSPNHLTS
jgi:hypothetical protein